MFNYIPMYGVVIAFKDFNMSKGILGSEWIGFEIFAKIFKDAFFLRAFRNTVILSFMTLIVNFPLTIIFALLINELANLRFKKVIQTISYLPHFLSWIVVSGFVYQLLSPQVGILNYILVNLDIIDKPIHFVVKNSVFRSIFLVSGLWKSIGWGTIIYLAAIAGIETSQYEAAIIDGANRFQRAIYITLPGITPTITILLILSVGRLTTVGFDQVFNLYNTAIYEVSDVISTFVYRKGLVDAKYNYSTAVGLFQNVVGFMLVFTANAFAKKFNEYTII